MKTHPSAYRLGAIIATLFAFLFSPLWGTANAQDIVGGAVTTRKDLSGGASKGGGPATSRTDPAWTGTLAVATEPGATVYLEPADGNASLEGTVASGERIFVFNRLKPGQYKVYAELDDKSSEEKLIRIINGQPASVTLGIVFSSYSITINTNVSTGEVRYSPTAIKGTEYVMTDGDFRVAMIQGGKAQLRKLRAGQYIAEVRAEGYKPERVSFNVTSESQFNVQLAVDPQPENRGLGLDEKRASLALPSRYYALVIGNNAYQELPRLKTAENDAREVAAILSKQFGFETKLLLNATRAQIFDAIDDYSMKLDNNASLLIYYAGHGTRVPELEKAYWQPVDAAPGRRSTWISADDITTGLRGIKARHILVISDSCYSGTIFREGDAALPTPATRGKYLEKMMAGKSRRLIASGGNEPVSDGGGGGHSVFAGALLKGLAKMEEEQFTAGELYRNFIEEAVAGGSKQTPEYKPIQDSGHENGDFVFARRK